MAEKTVPAVKNEAPLVKREITRNPDYFVTPLVDIFETKEGLTVVADLPGIEKDGLKISVEDGVLTIEGKFPEPGEKKGYLMREFEPLNFFRQFELPEMVDQTKIAAELKNGVLHLNLPKAEAAKPRQIEVKIA
jgi:HSP20 family protein